MAVAVASTSFAEVTSGTSVTCNIPTGVAAGDLLVAVVVGPTQTAPSAAVSGWTLDKSQNGFDAAANDGQTTYYRVATGSDSASYTFTGTGTANRMSVVMLRVTGADTTTPLDATSVSSAGAAGTSFTSPTITTVTANAVLLHLVSINASSTNTATLTPPSGLTQEVVTTGASGIGRKVWAYSEPRATTGATGSRSWTVSTAIQSATTTVAVRPSAGAPTPTLSRRMVDVPTGTGVTISTRTGSAASVRIKVGTDTGVTAGVIFSSAVTPNAQGDAIHTITGLTAGTRYYYRVAMTPSGGSESLDTAGTVGTFKTAPSGATSFAFNFGSCTNATDSASLAAIAARGDDLFFHLGDLYYDDASGNTAANIRTHFDAKLEAANHQAVLATTPTAYTPSDHDGMNNNSNAGSDATAWTNFNTVYREKIPAAGIPATTGVYRTFVWGRVRFIVMDTRSFATIPSATDNSSKTRLGATQKQWVKDTITAATEPVIVLVQADPWIGAAVAGDDAWPGYTTERTELATFFAASGKKIVLLHGDQHALAADDGTNAPGGITVFGAAPFNNLSSHKGGPYSAGTYPTTDGVTVQQYGRVAVTDTGSTVTLAFTGYSSDNTARITQSVTVAPPGAGTGSGSWGFTGAATGTRTPKATTAGSWTFTGAATGTRAPKAAAGGSWSYSGNAAGTRAPKGAATGSWTYTGAATGKRTPKSTAAGSFTYLGTGTGKRTPKGATSGAWSYTGTAAGIAPPVGQANGSAVGTFGYTGTATGSRNPKATAAGAWGYAGSSTGKRTPKASAAGAWAYAGTATGSAVHLGTATGHWGFTGAVVPMFGGEAGPENTLHVGPDRRDLAVPPEARVLAVTASPRLITA